MSPGPAGQGMFMVRYGTGFVSDEHDGRLPEVNPSLFRQAVQRTNTGKMADADPQRSDEGPSVSRPDRTGLAAGRMSAGCCSTRLSEHAAGIQVGARMACGGFAGGLRPRCGGFAGAATTESPRTRAKRLTSIPHVSGVFARVCWLSPNTNQSGRTVRFGLNTGDSGVLLPICYRHTGPVPGIPQSMPRVCHRERVSANARSRP